MITVEQIKDKISYKLQWNKNVWESAPETASLKESELERIKTCQEHLDEVAFLVIMHEIRHAINMGKKYDLNAPGSFLDLELTEKDNLYKLINEYDTRPGFNHTTLGDTIVQQTLKELGYTTKIPTSDELRDIEKKEIIAEENYHKNYTDANLHMQYLEAEKNSRLAKAMAGYAPFDSGLPHTTSIPSVIVSYYKNIEQDMKQNIEQELEQSDMIR